MGAPRGVADRRSDTAGWATAFVAARQHQTVSAASLTPPRDATGGSPSLAATKRERASMLRKPPKDELAAHPGDTSSGACRRRR